MYETLAAVFLLVLLFVAVRSFWLWYWRINRAIALLESIDESLKQLPAVRQHDYRGQRIHAVE